MNKITNCSHYFVGVSTGLIPIEVNEKTNYSDWFVPVSAGLELSEEIEKVKPFYFVQFSVRFLTEENEKQTVLVILLEFLLD